MCAGEPRDSPATRSAPGAAGCVVRGGAQRRKVPTLHKERDMTESATSGTRTPAKDVALIVGGGPGISSSCARHFARSGMLVGVAARDPDKPVLEKLEKTLG